MSSEKNIPIELRNLPKKRADRLRQKKRMLHAMKTVIDAKRGLNYQRYECDCCGLLVWSDEPEGRINRSMDSTLNHIRKTIGLITEDLQDIEELMDM